MALYPLYDLYGAKLVALENGVGGQVLLVGEEGDEGHHWGYQDDSFHLVPAGCLGSGVAA